MRRGQRPAGVSPPRNGRSRVVLSRVGDGGVLAIQGLALGRRKNTGPKNTVGLILRRNVLHQSYLPGAFFGPRVLPYNIAIVELCGTV